MLDVAAAEALIMGRVRPLDAETCRLTEAVSRVLAGDVAADRDQPPFDRVTLDGIAIVFKAWQQGQREFMVSGTQAAGTPALALENPAHCVEVMTGAMLPEGADTVIPVERLSRDGDTVRVADDTPVEIGQGVHARGSDRRAGSSVLPTGTRIGPAEVAVLASAGQAMVSVSRMPRVAVVATGDELVDVDQPVAPHQIRSTNDRAIAASLSGHHLATVTRTHIADDEKSTLRTVRRLHSRHDMLILSGGVSMGQFDFVPAALKALGADQVFHRIAQRPGKPMLFAVSQDGKLIFALPGNPVSTLVCLTRYVLPALRAAAGLRERPTEKAVLTTDVRNEADLTLFMPVVLGASDEGMLLAEPRPTNTSGDFMSLAGTDGFVELTRGTRSWRTGSVVRLFRW